MTPEDIISREAACKTLFNDCHIKIMSGNNWIRLEEAVSKLSALPSAQPELGKNTMPEQPKTDRLVAKTGETCADVISRQAAIDVIDAILPVEPMKNEYTQGITCGAALAIEYVKQLPSAQPEPKWIPCNEKLPEEGQRVLCTHEKGLMPDRKVIEHTYYHGKFCENWNLDTDFKSPTFGQHYNGKVIAWMPLPDPYAERREE